MTNKKENKYYVICNLDVARAVHFITGENYYIFDNVNVENHKVYSFRNLPKVRQAVDEVLKLREILG